MQSWKIIKFYGYFKDKENINKYKEIYKNTKYYQTIKNLNQDIDIYCLVLEYAPNGSIKDLIVDALKNHPNEQPNRDFIIKILK